LPSGVTDYGANAWLGVALAVTDPIDGYYIALCTVEPGIDFDGDILADVEPADGAYARQLYASGPTNWGTDGSYGTNLLEIDFGVPTVDWGFLPYYALCTAATSGDLYSFGEFLSPEYVQAGAPVVIPAGGIVLGLASVQDSIAV